MQSKATTVDQYLKELPDDRREAIEAVRAEILKNLAKGFEEGIQYGMIGYYVPHSLYPSGYHCDSRQPLPFAALASQKNHMSFYSMGIYANPEEEARFRKAWLDTGKKLDMGKSCIRFKKLEDVPLQVIGQTLKRMTVKKYIEHYETALQAPAKATGTKKKASKKSASRKKSAKKSSVASKKKIAKKKSASKSVAKKGAAKKGAAKKARPKSVKKKKS